MPDWWPALLIAVFAIHTPLFAWRYRKTREPRFAATTLTFVLLTATYAVRVLAPDTAIAGVSVFVTLRVCAWSAAAVSIGMLVRHLSTRVPRGRPHDATS